MIVKYKGCIRWLYDQANNSSCVTMSNQAKEDEGGMFNNSSYFSCNMLVDLNNKERQDI